MSKSTVLFTTLRSHDFDADVEEASAPSVRAQSAIVRTVADAIERLAASGCEVDGVRSQLVEELDRLRSCLVETGVDR